MNEIEYESYDFLMVMEALGGITEILFLLAGFLIGPYNHKQYLKE